MKRIIATAIALAFSAVALAQAPAATAPATGNTPKKEMKKGGGKTHVAKKHDKGMHKAEKKGDDKK